MHSTSKLVLSILLALIVAGGGVYFWQQSALNSASTQYQTQIASLQADGTKLKEENDTLKASTPQNIKFPVIVYDREGLLTATDEGKAEEKNLQQKLVAPFVDFNNEKQVNLVSLDISVPENVGEQYQVSAIFGNGVHQSFLFGKREQAYDYWAPECMGPCEFTDTFKAKYPQIVGK